MSIGADIVFLQNCRDVKNEVFKKIAFLCCCLFYVVDRQAETQWKKAPKPYKNSVLRWPSNNGCSGNCLKPQMIFFVEKVFLGMGEKVGFTDGVFGKLCLAETFLLCFRQTQQLQQKKCMLKKSEKLGYCWAWERDVFCLGVLLYF